MANPFFYGPHITNPAHFVGRDKELRDIFAALETAHTGQLQSVSIVGERRIGKSSLLYQLTQVYRHHLSQPDLYRVVYVDLQAAQCQTRAELLRHILMQLQISPPRSMELADFQTTLEQWRDEQGRRIYPVVCFDEFEQLTKNRNEFSDALFDAWRSLMNNGHIAFVTASRVSLQALSQAGKLTSPFFNVFHQVPLRELTEMEALSFERRGAECDRPFTLSERDWLREQGARHPCKLQIAGHLLYEAKGNSLVDMAKLQRQFKEQVAFVFGEAPTPSPRATWNDFAAWLRRMGNAVLTVPKPIGRFVLEVVFRMEPNKYSESTAAFTGWLALLLISAIVFYIGVGEALAVWLRAQSPVTPTPKP